MISQNRLSRQFGLGLTMVLKMLQSIPVSFFPQLKKLSFRRVIYYSRQSLPNQVVRKAAQTGDESIFNAGPPSLPGLKAGAMGRRKVLFLPG
jgi:hypothetical protein